MIDYIGMCFKLLTPNESTFRFRIIVASQAVVPNGQVRAEWPITVNCRRGANGLMICAISAFNVIKRWSEEEMREPSDCFGGLMRKNSNEMRGIGALNPWKQK